jgi:putative endopeptidase
MKTEFLAAAAALVVFSGIPAYAEDAKPAIGRFGFDTAGMDRSLRAGDDFYRYANGSWLRTTEIPADKSNYGMFTLLDDVSRERTRAIIEAAAAAKAPTGSEAQKVGDYFAAFMDEAAIEAKGLAPLQPLLDRIDQANSVQDLAVLFGELQQLQVNQPFAMFINQDAKAPDVYIPYWFQAGLGLPDRDYYLVDNPKFAEARDKYKAHIASMLTLAGVADVATKAGAIYALEHQMAEVQWNQVDSRDADKTYNVWTAAEFAGKAPGFDWLAFFKAAGLGDVGRFVVSQPSAFTGMAKLFADVPAATWRDYAKLRLLKDSAAFLPKAFVDENFAFNGKVLTGTPQLEERWKRGVNQVTAALGEAVGRLYVERHFPPASKAAADELVANVIAAMDARLGQLEWMSPATRTKAREKLASFTPKIGYPDRWRDYSALTIKPGAALANAEAATRFEYQRNLAKLGQPIDRSEWFMTPMTVNAYANPTMNEIVFPASILQPPFFDANADPAVNYGGIGAVIGHEITHHFDDQGRKFDKTGALADWWTEEDVKRFKTYTDRLVAQYNLYEPLPGQKVNGELTLGENIADLAGMTIAYDAYKRSLGGKPAPVIDGTTGDQRFYMGWAQVWRRKYRDENLQQRLVTDPHSPSEYRTTVVRNLDPWYDAFDVKPGDKLYLDAKDRVRIW